MSKKSGLGQYVPQVAQYSNYIDNYSKQFGIPATIIANVIMAESSGNAKAFKGEPQLKTASYGLMQVLETTAKSMGFVGDATQLYQPGLNIYYGTRLLKQYKDKLWPLFSDDTQEYDKWKVVASSYNQGPLYYENALKMLNMKEVSTSWQNVRDAVTTNTIKLSNGKTKPYTAYVDFYGGMIMGEEVEIPEIVNGQSQGTGDYIQRAKVAMEELTETISKTAVAASEAVSKNPVKSTVIGLVVAGAIAFAIYKMFGTNKQGIEV